MYDMNDEKRINCHLEGRSPRQDLINKCKDCNNEIEQKAYRASAKRDLYARSPNGSRLKMTEKVLSFLRLRGASGAQGISAPASCLEAHKRRFLFNLIRRSLEKFFKKNFRDDRFCFGFAKVTALALIFTIATISESRAADCPAGKESCGENCCYTIENGTVNFSRIDETKKASIKLVAFQNKNLSGQLVIPDWIKAIGTAAFRGNNLTSVILPDTISDLSPFVFSINPNLKEIVFSDSITADKVYDAFFYDTAKGVTIKCKGNMQKCQDNLAKFKKIDGKCSLQFSSYCYDLSFDTASEEQCNSTNYYWTGTECVYEPEVAKRTCTYDETGYVKVGNYCYSPEVTYAKKQYTPAEAAQWLRDGNDNFVVLTFKK